MSRFKSATWAPPGEFAEYRIIRALGSGAMGKVFLAHDTVLDRPVALKFLGSAHLSGVSRERFILEARALARLHHANVVGVFRVGEVDGRPYLVSEFVRGHSLDKLPKPAAWTTVLNQGIDLARGLAAAHRAGVLHRDIKPANAILSESGEVKLLDFGLAKLIEIHAERNPPVVQMELPLPPSVAQVLVGTDMEQSGSTLRTAVTPVVLPPLPAEMSQSWLPAPMPYVPPPLTRKPTATIMPPFESLSSIAGVITGEEERLTQSGALMGTPVYLAPELWDGAAATPRSDLYALGTMLFEMVVGHHPHRGRTVDEISTSIIMNDAPRVDKFVADIDPRFVTIIDRCLQRDPNQRYSTADELRHDLERLVAQLGAHGPAPTGNPYPGMMPFEAAQQALFFGRDAEVRDAVERVRTEPLVVVAGDAGVGKTSLIAAGVAPAIVAGAMGRGRTWHVATMAPGVHPAVSLATVLAPLTEQVVADVEALLREGDVSALDRLRHNVFRSLGAGQGLLLVLDPLEELITKAATVESQRICEFLAQLIAGGGNALRVVGAVRTDFLTRAASLPGLGELISSALYVLRPLPDAGVRQAVIGPAAIHQTVFEPLEIVDELVAAAQRGGLGLVQFALAELWHARSETNVITRAVLDRLGGIDGALVRHADFVFDTMAERDHASARDIVLGLIAADRSPVPRSEQELDLQHAPAQRAVEALIKGRLVKVRESENGRNYELAHEALILKWPRLLGWLDDDGERRIVRRRIEVAATEWLRLERSPTLLWTDRRLAEAAIVHPERLSVDAQKFIVKSRQAQRQEVRQRWIVRFGIPLLVVLVVVLVRARMQAAADARAAAEAAERSERVGELLDEAHRVLQKGQDFAAVDGKRLAALALFDQRENTKAEELWRQVLSDSHTLDATYLAATQPLEHASVVDPSRSDVRAELAKVLHLRAQLADHFYNIERRDESLRRLELYDTIGEYLNQWRAPADLTFLITPSNAVMTIATISANDGRRIEGPAAPFDRSASLPPGSYMFTVNAPGYSPVRYPMVLQPGEKLTVPITLVPADKVPADFVVIPAGRFVVGALDEAQRTSFLLTVPLHVVRTDTYLIAKHETTFREWIEFLRTRSVVDRRRLRPHTDGVNTESGWLDLSPTATGWLLRTKPVRHEYVATAGQPLQYLARKFNQAHDWSKLPVTGVSMDDAVEYAAWLRETGKVPNARPCTELEWERASRGADDRLFPHGNLLLQGDANFDETYNKEPDALGPDAVGLWPNSKSPFGVDDLAGNVAEWATLSLSAEPKLAVMRGGSFFYGGLTSANPNRNTLFASTRSNQLGIRMCAGISNG